METLVNQLKPMRDELASMMDKLGIPQKDAEAKALEEEASGANFWNDAQAAQKKMQKMAKLKAQVEKWQQVFQRVSDALELAELGDESLETELTTETNALTKIFDEMSLQAMLSGEYDSEDAILSIYAGAGGNR